MPTDWISVPLFVASSASLYLAFKTFRLSPFPGRISFIFLHLALAWWTGTVAIEHASEWPAEKLFWAEMAWLGIIGTPGAWLTFAWNYTHGRYQPVPRSLCALVAFLAAGMWLLALTNAHHHLVYTSTIITSTQPYSAVRYLHGVAYFVICVYGYSAMLLSEIVMLYAAVHASDVYRKHYFILGTTSLLPFMASLLYFAREFGAGGGAIDPTPFAAVIMVAIFFWLIDRQRSFDVLPMAHSVLLDALPDAVLVLDDKLRIAGHNPAATRLLGDRPLLGVALSAIPTIYEGLRFLNEPEAGNDEAVIGDPARYFDVGQVPLRYAGRDVGRLIVLRDISRRKEAETRLLALQQQLREQSIRDALTGLHNRRFLDELGPVMLDEAERSGGSLAAVMLDIDHFKRFNDTYGHEAGDAMLRAAGSFLLQNVRQTDAVFRMGGEEFLVLLPQTQLAQALARADAWRREFMDARVDYEGRELQATISAGIAVYPADAGDLRALLHHADLALYGAKGSGRNRVVAWASEEQSSRR